MHVWDYNIKKGWKPTTKQAWIWYLERKINYDDWKGLEPAIVQEHLPQLHLDPGRRLMLQAYFDRYGAHKKPNTRSRRA